MHRSFCELRSYAQCNTYSRHVHLEVGKNNNCIIAHCNVHKCNKSIRILLLQAQQFLNKKDYAKHKLRNCNVRNKSQIELIANLMLIDHYISI